VSTTQTQQAPSEDEAEALQALTSQLAEMAEKAPSHNLMLIALLSTYKAVAITHPCCTRGASQAALQVGGDLLVRTLGNVPTGPLH
jgi:hypothetical protein